MTFICKNRKEKLKIISVIKSTSPQNTIVLIAGIYPQRFLDQTYFAKQLEKKSDERIKVLFVISQSVENSYPKEIKLLGPKIIGTLASQPVKRNSRSQRNFRRTLPSPLQRIVEKLLHLIKKYLKTTPLGDRYWEKEEEKFFKNANRKSRYVKTLIVKHSISVVLLGGDRHTKDGNEPSLLKACKELGVPVIIPYLAYFAEEENLLRSRQRFRHRKRKFFFSNYIQSFQSKFSREKQCEHYFYPPSIAKALERLGVLSENPWVMGRGDCSLICLPNAFLLKKYRGLGVSPQKLCLTGDVSYDQLFIQFRKRKDIHDWVCTNYKFNGKKKLIIAALPQLAEHGFLDWESHWNEISFLVDSLANAGENLLLSLHPKMNKEKYLFLENKTNCRILDRKLVEVLPSCDLFVATFSSTVLWAVLCGISSVVIDFYGFNYRMYDFLDSIDKVEEKKAFIPAIQRNLHRKIDFTADWEALSRGKIFDGNVINRYIHLVEAESSNVR